MAISTVLKSSVNKLLQNINLKIDTLTSLNIEKQRLKDLEHLQHFEKPVFPTLQAFNSKSYQSILEKLKLYEQPLNDLNFADKNQVGYSYENPYFTSPDAEVLYTIIRQFKPQKIIEVGCGNSTKISRQAILDEQLGTHLISIDPYPRTEIAKFSNELFLKPVEALENLDVFQTLQKGDILFIDSSHQIKTGNDVVFLYTNIIPNLNPGVLIHIHDVFLPYDYPKQWVLEEEWGWNEQYLVQCMLQMSNSFDVLWAGHFLQRTLANFQQYFPNLDNRIAQSLWLEKIY